LSDPQTTRERAGCVTFFPILIIASVVPGYLGFLLGELLAPVVNIPELGFRLAFLAGADGLGLACLLYWRTVGGSTAQMVLAPLYVFFLFMAIGIKCGAGIGGIWFLVWGIANGAFGLIVALCLLRRTEPPATDGC
jgi:hypothetical protein